MPLTDRMHDGVSQVQACTYSRCWAMLDLAVAPKYGVGAAAAAAAAAGGGGGIQG
jgi:hypothetical protein